MQPPLIQYKLYLYFTAIQIAMNDRLHIIIAGDEGKTKNLLLSKRNLKITLMGMISLFIALAIGSYTGFHSFRSNKTLTTQITTLNQKLTDHATELDRALTDQAAELNAALAEQTATLSEALQHKTLQLTEERRNNTLNQETLDNKITSLQKQNKTQAQEFQQEKSTIIHTTISELEERSDMIENIMDNLGIEVKKIPENSDNSGGPFISPRDTLGKDLLFRTNNYLKKISYLPLGRPIPGKITSRYGPRTDPLNKKKGFHSGVDIKGPYGQKILATADGTVTKSTVNGSWGHYIKINHGNGYLTIFAHMKKRLVKKGEKVIRGQTIGTVGSSGRSTGPHLHYELRLNNKPVSPHKFMNIEKLVLAADTSKAKVKKLVLTADASKAKVKVKVKK